jgi:hypothetical protein
VLSSISLNHHRRFAKQLTFLAICSDDSHCEIEHLEGYQPFQTTLMPHSRIATVSAQLEHYRLDGLNNQHLFPIALEAGSPKSRYGQN